MFIREALTSPKKICSTTKPVGARRFKIVLSIFPKLLKAEFKQDTETWHILFPASTMDQFSGGCCDYHFNDDYPYSLAQSLWSLDSYDLFTSDGRLGSLFRYFGE